MKTKKLAVKLCLCFIFFLSFGSSALAHYRDSLYCDIMPGYGNTRLPLAIADYQNPSRRLCQRAIRLFGGQTIDIRNGLNITMGPPAGRTYGLGIRKCYPSDNHPGGVCPEGLRDEEVVLDATYYTQDGGDCPIKVGNGARIEIRNLTLRVRNSSKAVCTTEGAPIPLNSPESQYAYIHEVRIDPVFEEPPEIIILYPGYIALICRDGRVGGREACDDGNSSNTDACLNDCTLARCGDGHVRADVETCDDGNTVNTDACPNTCTPARCGDGILYVGTEQCDDGNTTAGDGCNASCQRETTTLPPVCGDGTCHVGETVDSCAADCRPTPPPLAVCGNSAVESGELCDDGNTVNTDSCPNTCMSARCGDGILYVGTEQCDDGNTTAGDGCNASCQTETTIPPPPPPDQTDSDGDGLSNSDETSSTHTDPQDPDTDGDGYCDGPQPVSGINAETVVCTVQSGNRADNCPLVSNPGQTDSDSDNVGDDCENDNDGDDIADDTDNCRFVDNPGQNDTDGNGTGDACDPAFTENPNPPAAGSSDGGGCSLNNHGRNGGFCLSLLILLAGFTVVLTKKAALVFSGK